VEAGPAAVCGALSGVDWDCSGEALDGFAPFSWLVLLHPATANNKSTKKAYFAHDMAKSPLKHLMDQAAFLHSIIPAFLIKLCDEEHGEEYL
jgi:hypothetical protein